MAKSNNQKAKILFLEQLLRETGENRTVSMQEILDQLSEKGITAERKSVYDDMEALRFFGMDVKFRRGRPGGYYLSGRTAEEGISSNSEQEEKVESQAVKAAGNPFVKGNASSDKKMKLICLAESEEEVRGFFGDAAEYDLRGDGTLHVTASLLMDRMFYGWLTAMGKNVKLAKPKKAVQNYREYLKMLTKEYK